MENNEALGFAIVSFGLLCCCCTVLLAAVGGGVWYFVRRNRQPAASVPASAPTFTPTPTYTPPPPPIPPTPPPASYESLLTKEPPPAPAQDVRRALLALNGPDKVYEVRAEGDRLFCVLVGEGLDPTYRLEIVLDEANHVAGFMEVGTGGESTARADARQVLETARWTVQD
jgi:hypothetical protein